MKNILFFFSISLLIASCDGDFFSQTVNLDPPEYDKQLSFHLLMDQNDTTVSIVVTRNYGILENIQEYQDWFVSGASAQLYENGQPWVTLAPLNADSLFVLTATLPHRFQLGNTYEIRASHPDFPAVSARQVVPADFVVDSARVKFNAVPTDFGDRIDLAEIFIKDQPGVKNFYEVRLVKPFYQIVFNETTFELDTVGVIVGPISVEGYNDPNIVEGYRSGGLLSDQFFDGQTYKFQVRFDKDYYGSADTSLQIEVRSISEDYYKWSRSLQAYYNADGNPLVEPVTIFHNLENGLGIFSIANLKRIQI